MKNDSPFYKFPTLDDKRLDANKDGKLTGTETVFRDAHLMEISDKIESETNNQQPSYAKGHSTSKITPFSILMLVLFVLFLLEMLSK